MNKLFYNAEDIHEAPSGGARKNKNVFHPSSLYLNVIHAQRLLWRGLVRSLRRMYTRGEKESRHREIELGYDEDTFEEIFVTNMVV